MLAFYELGSGSGHTIIGGAEELLHAGLWPLALLVFLASIAVPCLKILGLGTLLITTQRRSRWQLRQRTTLYRIVSVIGRWSMVDIFMELVLVGLVQFGAIVTIGPGPGALAFCGVVILTIFAAESFDLRLMWDAASADIAHNAYAGLDRRRARSSLMHKPFQRECWSHKCPCSAGAGGGPRRGPLAVELWKRVAVNVWRGVAEGCGHWIPEERPDWTLQQLLTFFGRR